MFDRYGYKYAIIAVIYCLFSFPSSAQDISSWPHEDSDLLPDPAIVFGNLPNGFRYVLMENSNPRDRVSVHLYVKAGSMNEQDGQEGLAHFNEHLLFCGSTHFKPGELIKYFQGIGMEFGPDANAHTSFYETVYDIILPDGSEKTLEKGLMVMQDYAEGALLLESEIDRERKVVLAEKISRDSVSYRTFISTLNFELPGSLFAERLPIGKDETLEKADRNLVKDFYDTWYRPERMILIMVGDFDKSTAVSLIGKKFSKIEGRAPAKTDPGIDPITHKGVKTFYHFEKEAGNTNVCIEVLGNYRHKQDSISHRQDLLIRRLANMIVGNRLEALTGKPDTPFTSASISSGVFLDKVEYAEIGAECSPGNWEKTLALLEQILRQSLLHGFTTAELERVKKDYQAALDNAVKKAPTRESGHLARQIMSGLGNGRVLQSPAREKEVLEPIIKALSLEKIHEVFKKDWSPDHRLVIVTGNAEIEKSGERIPAVYEKSVLAEVSKPLEKKPVVFPYLPEPEKKGKIIQRNESGDLGIVRIDFENGVRLNLKKTDFKASEVLVNISFGMGRSCEPADKPGLSVLCEGVVNESGFGSLEKDEIERAMAGKNTYTSFNLGDDRFSFSGKTIPEEIPLLFQLMYAHLTDPGFREDSFSLVMERFRQRDLELSRSIEGAVILHGKRFLAGGDTRFGLLSATVFQKYSIDDVRSWLTASLNNDEIEVNVVGDFEIDSVIENVSKYIGSLPKRHGALITKRPGPGFPASQTLIIEVETEIPKGLITVAYPTEDIWDIHRTRRLSTLAGVFSERLRVRIREKLGASYSPNAFNRPSRAYPGYGVFQAIITVAPEESGKVVEEVESIAGELAKNGVTQEELRRTIDPILTNIKDTQRKNHYWIGTVLTGSEKHPQQLEWSRTILKDYDSITPEEISSLAGKYLDNGRVAVVVSKPIKN